MNTKVIGGVVAVIVIAGGAALFLRPGSTVAPTDTSKLDLATSTTKGSKPTFHVGTSSIETVQPFALFDSLAFSSTSTYPTVTGSANTAKIGIVINNSQNVGIVGTWEIPVTNGRWSYSTSVALPPGTYNLLLFVGTDSVGTAKLTVK